MYLPKIPYKMAKNKSFPISMRGINYTNVLSDGDIVDSKNISARSYPYITTREGRPEVDGQGSDIQAMTSFQGKIVTFDGETLYYDGNEVGTLSPGEKQFAVINTKLVIMPDKVYLDGNTLTLHELGAWWGGNSASFSTNMLKITSPFSRVSGFGAGFSNRSLSDPKASVQGSLYLKSEISLLSKRCAMIEKSNDKIKITPIKKVGTAKISGNTSAGSAFVTIDLSGCSAGEIDSIVIASEFDPTYMVFGERNEGQLDLSKGYGGGYNENTQSFIYPISAASLKSAVDSTVDFYVYDNDVMFPEEPGVGDYYYINAKSNKISTSGYFKGQAQSKYIEVTVPEWEKIADIDSGHVAKVDVVRPGWKQEILDALEIDTQFIVRGSKQNDNVVYKITEKDGGFIYLDSECTEESVTGPLELGIVNESIPSFDFKVGDVVLVSGAKEEKNNKWITILGIDIHANEVYITTTDNAFVEGEGEEIVEIERKIPDLDFICEYNNRLWGCSNKDRMIYASSLGDPTNFYDLSLRGDSSDALPVGSPEDFTACCSYNDAVIFFKESKIHKVLGTGPQDHTGYAYDVEGVQKGCEKSLAIIDEVLYYKGLHGVYAYTGSPKLISHNFGNKKFYDAVAGHDGDTYYISMSDDERSYLFAYEINNGMWVLEDDIRVLDYARAGSDTYMLCDDGKIYLSGAGDSEEDIEWYVQFAPFYETISGKKSYSRIVLRLELPEGSYLIAEVKTDGGMWREAGKIVGKREGIVPVQIPINRCDRFEIRLSGRGSITIHTMVREFFVGGDK